MTVVKRVHKKLLKGFLSSRVMEISLTELGIFGPRPNYLLSIDSLCSGHVHTFSQPGRGSALGEERKQLAQVLRRGFQSRAVRLAEGLGARWAQWLLDGCSGETPCHLDGGCGAAPPGGPRVLNRSEEGRACRKDPFGTQALGCGQ